MLKRNSRPVGRESTARSIILATRPCARQGVFWARRSTSLVPTAHVLRGVDGLRSAGDSAQAVRDASVSANSLRFSGIRLFRRSGAGRLHQYRGCPARSAGEQCDWNLFSDSRMGIFGGMWHVCCNSVVLLQALTLTRKGGDSRRRRDRAGIKTWGRGLDGERKDTGGDLTGRV